jgi:hypothetical protein
MTTSSFVLGHDLSAVGKWSRLILGVGGVLMAGARAVEIGVVPETALYFVLIAAAYLLAHRVLGERVLGRMNPWVGTILLVGPAVVIPGLSMLPVGLRLGMITYFSASLFVNAVMNYGGCEVLALPSLLFRRWYTVYCPLNVIDAVEKRLSGEAGARSPEAVQ